MNNPRFMGSIVWRDDFTANEADLNWLTRYDHRVRNHDVDTLHQHIEDLAGWRTPVHGIDGGLYTSYIYDHPIRRPLHDYRRLPGLGRRPRLPQGRRAG
jgi:hypothetical protein